MAGTNVAVLWAVAGVSALVLLNQAADTAPRQKTVGEGQARAETDRTSRAPDLDRKIECVLALRKLGESGVLRLRSLLDGNDAVLRRPAARSLGRLNATATSAVGDLCRALERDDQELRLVVIEALMSVGSGDADAGLRAQLQDGDAKVVAAALHAIDALEVQPSRRPAPSPSPP